MYVRGGAGEMRFAAGELFYQNAKDVMPSENFCSISFFLTSPVVLACLLTLLASIVSNLSKFVESGAPGLFHIPTRPDPSFCKVFWKIVNRWGGSRETDYDGITLETRAKTSLVKGKERCGRVDAGVLAFHRRRKKIPEI